MSTFTFSTFFTAMEAGVSQLVSVAAGLESSVHTLESTDPALATIIAAVEAEIPGFSQIEGIGEIILAVAQTAVKALTVPTPVIPAEVNLIKP